MPLFDAVSTETTVAGATTLVLIGQLTTNTDSLEGKLAAPFSLKNHRHTRRLHPDPCGNDWKSDPHLHDRLVPDGSYLYTLMWN